MNMRRWIVDVAVLGIAGGCSFMIFLCGLAMGFISARNGNWFGAVFYVSTTTAAGYIIYWFCRKVGLFS